MKYIILFLLIPFFGFSQGGTWPIKYGDSDPSGAPSAAGTRLYFNTATNTLFTWEPAPSSTWRKQPKAFDQISGCAAPAYTPTARQSTFAVNTCTSLQNGHGPELYQYTGSAWECLNCVDGLNLTAGAGITLSGTAPDITISAVDASATNELNTSLSVSGSNLQIIDAGGTLTVPVSSIAPIQAVAAGDGINISGTTTRTITNSAPDQTVTMTDGTGIDVTGTYPNFTVSSTISGTANYITKFSSSTALGNSVIYEDSGAIGIGNTSPTGKLHITGTGSTSSTFTAKFLNSTSNNTLMVRDDGRVGIGTSNPSALLHVTGDVANSEPFRSINTDPTQTGGGARFEVTGANNAIALFRARNGNGDIWALSNAGKMAVGYSIYSTPPQSRIDVGDTAGYSQFRLRTSYTPTGTADALGATGDTAWDANYFYIKTAAGWKRAALSTF